MVGVEDPWDFGLPQGVDFILGLVAEILADLHHHNRSARIESLQEWPVEIPELDFRILGLGQLDLQ